MSEKPETRFVRRIKESLATLPHQWSVKTQMLATRGIPDILAGISGAFVAIEAKKDLKAMQAAHKKDPLQIHVLSQIARAGNHAFLTCPEIWPETFARIQQIALRHGGVPLNAE